LSRDASSQAVGSARSTSEASYGEQMGPVRITWIGVLVNAALGALKVAAGVLTGAQTLVADGLHSFSDLLTDAAVLAGLRVSSRPADESHHYGHRRVTTLVTLFIGGALLAAAVWIVYRAIATYSDSHPEPRAGIAFWIAAASILPKEILYRVTRLVGMRARDTSIIANAWHHRTDAFTSMAAAAGLAGVALGGPNLAFLDHLTAAILAAFLGVAALRFIGESLGELIDQAPGADVIGCIGEAISATPGVAGFHALRIRKLGGALSLDVHVLVEPELSVVEGHDVAEAAHDRILACGCNVIEAVVHVEPVGSDADQNEHGGTHAG
jgi:cation diffusion facilitator family transporter